VVSRLVTKLALYDTAKERNTAKTWTLLKLLLNVNNLHQMRLLQLKRRKLLILLWKQKLFNNFKSVKLHTVLDSALRMDPLDDDVKIAVRGWAAQCFPHGLAPSDNYPPNGRPRALTRAVTESLDASFEAYVKSLIDDF
jgi:hypothetical protein